ncbi:hypothetical protein RF656_14345 [Yersinia kristensenii]|uniref:hypothetical protein n=1 Tax=Yersinia kristensenii TaxID=28152 RepID=UPI0028531071|nr:hypothetical protein [Yersinia kristensenii]MDR4897914.1 hypothetical protein [Yersinia kristensenii]MDX6737929.1 hypothetical protein [Yersinia kristensenii]
MTQDQQTLLMFKGLIASLPAETQTQVKEAEKKLRVILADYPEGALTVAKLSVRPPFLHLQKGLV